MNENNLNWKIYTYLHTIRVVKESDGYGQQYIENREHEAILCFKWIANKLLVLIRG